MAVSSWYVVVESLGQWWVDVEGKPFGPFEDIGDATDGAIKLARTIGDGNKLLRVMVPNGTGGFDVAWERLAARSD